LSEVKRENKPKKQENSSIKQEFVIVQENKSKKQGKSKQEFSESVLKNKAKKQENVAIKQILEAVKQELNEVKTENVDISQENEELVYMVESMDFKISLLAEENEKLLQKLGSPSCFPHRTMCNMKVPIEEHWCASCGKSAKNKCAKCKAVWYCSSNCQFIEWKSHKLMCKEPENLPNKSLETNENVSKSNKNPIIILKSDYELDTKTPIILPNQDLHPSRNSTQESEHLTFDLLSFKRKKRKRQKYPIKKKRLKQDKH